MSQDAAKDFFAAGDFERAKKEWAGRLRSTQYILSKAEDEPLPNLDEYVKIAINSANNLALVNLKLECWTEAIAAANVALKYDPHNQKALYRLAKGQAELANLEDATATLSKCDAHDPAVVKLRATIAQDKRRRRNINQKIIKGMAKENARDQPRWWASPASLWVAGAVAAASLTALYFVRRH